MKMYEGVAKTVLMKRMPVIIRIDGKAFHTFTRGFQKPFDDVLIKTMQETTKYLCEHIQGCVFGYTQSDEITLVLCDYQTYDTSAWYDNEVQKLCSISASMATMKFNQAFKQNIDDKTWMKNKAIKFGEAGEINEKYYNAIEKGAMFDSRCFNIPKEDVANVILWRQQDAVRNSIQMVGQCNFSHKQLQGKSCNMIQDMLHEEKGINWNDFETYKKRGSAVIKDENGKWFVDLDMPIITQDRNYVESRIIFE